ncbi:UNVERIFIED_CONTAM: hypothetical protein K2H54_044825 [Gekko kuhli]
MHTDTCTHVIHSFPFLLSPAGSQFPSFSLLIFLFLYFYPFPWVSSSAAFSFDKSQVLNIKGQLKGPYTSNHLCRAVGIIFSLPVSLWYLLLIIQMLNQCFSVINQCAINHKRILAAALAFSLPPCITHRQD